VVSNKVSRGGSSTPVKGMAHYHDGELHSFTGDPQLCVKPHTTRVAAISTQCTSGALLYTSFVHLTPSCSID
jgi:hypothetical protein